MRNRTDLAEQFASRGFVKGAEVGVADGRYSEILCEKIPGLELIAVDPFYRKGHYEKAKERLNKYNTKIIRKTSMEGVLDYDDGFFDFVFIDGNHKFDFVMEDIVGWSRKVRKDGIIAGHDYYQFHNSGIIEAVNAYVESHKINLNLTLWDYDGHKDDRCPCWWFYKK